MADRSRGYRAVMGNWPVSRMNRKCQQRIYSSVHGGHVKPAAAPRAEVSVIQLQAGAVFDNSNIFAFEFALGFLDPREHQLPELYPEFFVLLAECAVVIEVVCYSLRNGHT